jgi:hypothetical protein
MKMIAISCCSVLLAVQSRKIFTAEFGGTLMG